MRIAPSLLDSCRMERRTFIAAMTGCLLAAPRAAVAQQAGKVYRIGLLEYSTPDPARQALWTAFRQRMRELGYVEGQNVTFEPRWAQDDSERLSKLATELVGLKVDVIVTAATVSALAAKRATVAIPIVMATGADPMAVGLVANLRQPGGNVTGMTTINSELAAKRLELLRIVAPRASRIAILWDEKGSTFGLAVKDTEAAARRAGFTVQSVPVGSPAEIEAAFATVVRGSAGALSIAPSPMFFSNRKRLADLAVKHRLPTIVALREYAAAGGLISYGADNAGMFRSAAVFVDKILKGAKPADLPVEQPWRYVLAVNLKTAKALGLTMPPSLLQRVDEVVQ